MSVADLLELKRWISLFLRFALGMYACTEQSSTATHHLLGLWIIGILVRVIFERQSPVPLFDLLVRRRLGDLKQLV